MNNTVLRTYRASMTVELTVNFRTDQEALEWFENHTVFDMLDRNASVTSPLVTGTDENGETYLLMRSKDNGQDQACDRCDCH